jgi:hypothetical protein
MEADIVYRDKFAEPFRDIFYSDTRHEQVFLRVPRDGLK